MVPLTPLSKASFDIVRLFVDVIIQHLLCFDGIFLRLVDHRVDFGSSRSRRRLWDLPKSLLLICVNPQRLRIILDLLLLFIVAHRLLRFSSFGLDS